MDPFRGSFLQAGDIYILSGKDANYPERYVVKFSRFCVSKLKYQKYEVIFLE